MKLLMVSVVEMRFYDYHAYLMHDGIERLGISISKIKCIVRDFCEW